MWTVKSDMAIKRVTLILATVGAAAISVGCGQKNRTEIIVGLATDLTAPTPLSMVHLEVLRLPEIVKIGEQDFPISGNSNNVYEIPGTYGVYSANGAADRVQINLTATDPGGLLLVKRTAVLNLVPGRTLFVRLGVISACQGMNDCPTGDTCISGRCAPDEIDSSRLPNYMPGIEKEISCTSPGDAVFIDTNTRQRLSVVGASCPNQGMCLEGVCLASPGASSSGGATGSGGGGGRGAGGAGGAGGARGAGGAGGAGGGSVVSSCRSAVGDGGARFAFVAATSANQIFAYTVAANTGALTATGSPISTSEHSFQIAVDPSNKYLLVAGFGVPGTCDMGCALVSYAIDQTTGALTPAGRAAAGTNPISLAVNSSSTRVYTANTNSDDLSIFTLDPASGAVSASGTVAAGHFPEWITLSPDGKFLYVANTGTNNVSEYSVDAVTGALTSIGTVAAGTSPTFVIVHPTGRFAYAANADSNTVTPYSRNIITGVLTPAANIPAGPTSRAIAIDPTGRFAYVAVQTQIMTFAIDPGNGLLTPLGTPTPASPGSQPFYLTTDPGGTHLYVGHAGTNTVELFAIDTTTGALCPVGGPVEAGSNSFGIALMR